MMTSTTTIIEGTGIRSKDKGILKGNFEQIPHSIFNYMKLGLISGNDLGVYLFLLKNDNNKKGFAYPTVLQIALETGIGDKTVKKSTKRLSEVGLIKKEKAPNYPSKNIYFVHLPLEKEILYKQVPHLLSELEQKGMEYESEAKRDKQRLDDYNKQRQAENL